MPEPLALNELVPAAEPLVDPIPSRAELLPSADPSAAGLGALIGNADAPGSALGLGKTLTTLCTGASADVPLGRLGRALVELGLVAEAVPLALWLPVPLELELNDEANGLESPDVPVGRLGKDVPPAMLDRLGRLLEPGLVTETVPPTLRLLVPLELELNDNVSGPLVVVNEPLELESPVSGSSALPAVSSTVLTGAGAVGVLIVVPAAEMVTELSAAVTVKGTVAVPPFWSVPVSP